MIDPVSPISLQYKVAIREEFLDLAGDNNPILLIDFTNYKGERRERKVRPLRRALWFGVTKHHPECQWFLHAWDLEKNEERDFPIKNMHAWKVQDEQCGKTSEGT